MSSTAIFLTALTAAGLVLLLWVIGRAVTAAGNRVSSADSRSRHYLAGRLDGVQITAIIDYDDELLVSLATQDAPLAGVFRITASTCSLTRVRRWHDESTPLRAYLSHDGAIMLADPALGGNAPCEPPTPDIYHARDEATPPRPLAYQGQMTCAAKRPVAVLPARPPAMQAAAGELRRFPGLAIRQAREWPQRRAPALGGDKDQGPCGSRPETSCPRPTGATPHGGTRRGTCGLRGHAAPIRAKPSTISPPADAAGAPAAGNAKAVVTTGPPGPRQTLAWSATCRTTQGHDRARARRAAPGPGPPSGSDGSRRSVRPPGRKPGRARRVAMPSVRSASSAPSPPVMPSYRFFISRCLQDTRSSGAGCSHRASRPSTP